VLAEGQWAQDPSPLAAVQWLRGVGARVCAALGGFISATRKKTGTRGQRGNDPVLFAQDSWQANRFC